MADDRNAAGAGGIGFLGLLALLFITLKLCGVIQWSWLYVLAPLWVPALLCALFVLFCVCMAVLAAAVKQR